MLSQLHLCSTHLFVHRCTVSLLHRKDCQSHGDNLFGMAYQANPFMRCKEKGLRPMLCKWLLLLPFISITSYQNSSPTEVATVPLAIKIMLGHAMVVCDSTVGNKSSGSSGNDANSWVVNLEQCRRKPVLWFLQETASRPRLHLSLWAWLGNIKQGDKKQHHLISVFFTTFYMQPQVEKGMWVFSTVSQEI